MYCGKLFTKLQKALGTVQFPPRQQAPGHQLGTSWVILCCYSEPKDLENLGASGTPLSPLNRSSSRHGTYLLSGSPRDKAGI